MELIHYENCHGPCSCEKSCLLLTQFLHVLSTQALYVWAEATCYNACHACSPSGAENICSGDVSRWLWHTPCDNLDGHKNLGTSLGFDDSPSGLE